MRGNLDPVAVRWKLDPLLVWGEVDSVVVGGELDPVAVRWKLDPLLVWGEVDPVVVEGKHIWRAQELFKSHFSSILESGQQPMSIMATLRSMFNECFSCMFKIYFLAIFYLFSALALWQQYRNLSTNIIFDCPEKFY